MCGKNMKLCLGTVIERVTINQNYFKRSIHGAGFITTNKKRKSVSKD